MSAVNLVARGANVEPPPSEGFNPDPTEHLPDGLTLVDDVYWDTPIAWAVADRDGPTPTIVTDANNPYDGRTTALRQDWEGVPDGQSPDFCYLATTGSQMFASSVQWLDPSFGIPGNELKWITILAPSGGFWMLAFYRGGSTYGDPAGATDQMIIRLLRRAGTDVVSRIDLRDATRTIPLGEVFKVSVHTVDSPARVRCWLNESLLFDTDDLVNVSDLSGTTAYTLGALSSMVGEYQQGSTWGGGNIVPAPAGTVINYYRTTIYRAV